jgi:hypothetical protein
MKYNAHKKLSIHCKFADIIQGLKFESGIHPENLVSHIWITDKQQPNTETIKAKQAFNYQKLSGCDHSRFLVVPDWYANGCCRVIALEQTQYSMLNVYLVFKNKVHKVQVSEKYVQTTR